MEARPAAKFRNLSAEYRENTLVDVIKWLLQRRRKDIPGPEAYHFQLAANNPRFLAANRSATTLTWIGHATVLLQIAGKNILTDPQFSKRAFPVRWAGPKRVVPPGLAMSSLPPIDLVLITHDHYDSLDRQSVQDLVHRINGERTLFIVPLKLGRLLSSWGVLNVSELGWWQGTAYDGLQITAIPTQHWSKRAMRGRNERLWAGWVITTNGFRFCFLSDTGYDAGLFQEVGRRYGPFDLAAIPIGAYEPRWFMGKNHVNPEEAVRLHRDLRARKSVAIHWGTFILTDEPLDEPPAKLAEARTKLGLTGDEFVILRHGETLVFQVTA